MPDKDGILTAEDRKKVSDWIAKYPPTIGVACPICASSEWMLAQHIVQPITLGAGGALQLGGTAGYPQIMLISGCGYTRYVNAVMLGILPGDVRKDG